MRHRPSWTAEAFLSKAGVVVAIMEVGGLRDSGGGSVRDHFGCLLFAQAAAIAKRKDIVSPQPPQTPPPPPKKKKKPHPQSTYQRPLSIPMGSLKITQMFAFVTPSLLV